MPLHEALAKFTDPKNKTGSEVKVFLGTDVITEGLDFKYIRQLYILEPWFNVSKHEQTIGRAIRFCSHLLLDPSERNVEIFLLGTTNKKDKDKKFSETETLDLRRYRIAEDKDVKIEKIKRILKVNAIDCYNYKKRNLISGSKKITQISSRGNRQVKEFKDYPFTKPCNYLDNCNYVCTYEPKGKIKLDSDTYDLIFNQRNILMAQRAINELFKHHVIFNIDEIKDFVMKKYPNFEERFIYKALDNIIQNKTLIYDKYDRKGKIIYKGYYYIFQPLDLAYEKIPVELRIHPFPKKPKSIKLLDTVIKKFNITNKNRQEIINENLINNIVMEINYLEEILSEIKKKDTSRGNSSFYYGITGLVIDHLETKILIEFIRQIIREVYSGNLNKKYKLILDYIDPYLVKYDREIKKKSKNDIYGYIVKRRMHVL